MAESAEIVWPDLRLLFQPESVAVIGASASTSRATEVGAGALLTFLIKHGYPGKIYPINPKYPEIHGFKAYPSVLDVPDEIDTAVISLSNVNVLGALEQCARKKVKFAIVMSAGFAEEEGSIGRERQAQIRTLCASTGLRVLGPNCLGVINVGGKTAVSGSAALAVDQLLPGHIGLVSQSGALSSSIIDRSYDRKIGFSYFVSSGNEADLETTDFIRFLLDDEGTNVVAAFVEGFKVSQKFIAVARYALGKRKPLLIFKLGRTEKGVKAALAHTGSMMGSDEAVEAVFKQNGVIRIDELDALFETAFLLGKYNRTKGRRAAILTMSGGLGGVLADKSIGLGIQLPDPSPHTLQEMAKILPTFAAKGNPIDATGVVGTQPHLIRNTLSLLNEDEGIDNLIVGITVSPQNKTFAEGIVEIANTQRKPVVACWYGGTLMSPGLQVLKGGGVPTFDSPDLCLKSLKALIDYSDFQKAWSNLSVGAPMLDGLRKEEVRKRIHGKGRALTERESKEILSLYGVSSTRERLAISAAEAVLFAEEIGYPVVLKIDSPDILHKTEAKGIRVGVKNKEEIWAAYGELIQNGQAYNPQAKLNGVLVQEMVEEGVEVIIGVSKDKQFGPTVMFGLGGIFVELLKDVSFRVCPLSAQDAKKMIQEVKGAKVLQGFRGKPEGDVEELERTLLKISTFALECSDFFQEVDINPLVVRPKGKGVKMIDALLVLEGK